MYYIGSGMLYKYAEEYIDTDLIADPALRRKAFERNVEIARQRMYAAGKKAGPFVYDIERDPEYGKAYSEFSRREDLLREYKNKPNTYTSVSRLVYDHPYFVQDVLKENLSKARKNLDFVVGKYGKGSKEYTEALLEVNAHSKALADHAPVLEAHDKKFADAAKDFKSNIVFNDKPGTVGGTGGSLGGVGAKAGESLGRKLLPAAATLGILGVGALVGSRAYRKSKQSDSGV